MGNNIDNIVVHVAFHGNYKPYIIPCYCEASTWEEIYKYLDDVIKQKGDSSMLYVPHVKLSEINNLFNYLYARINNVSKVNSKTINVRMDREWETNEDEDEDEDFKVHVKTTKKEEEKILNKVRAIINEKS